MLPTPGSKCGWERLLVCKVGRDGEVNICRAGSLSDFVGHWPIFQLPGASGHPPAPHMFAAPNALLSASNGVCEANGDQRFM